MKIAVCLSGIMNHYKTGHSMMSSFYEGCEREYYIHSWSDASKKGILSEELISFFCPRKIQIDSFCDFSNHFGDADLDLTRLKNGNLSNAVSWLKSVYEVGKLIESDDREYDYVVFTRPDVFASGDRLLATIPEKNDGKIYSSFVSGAEWVVDQYNLPESGRGHIDAKFICSTKSNMVYFSKLYECLYKYVIEEKVPMCHHRLMYHHMMPIIKNVGHQQIWVSNQSLNGGWFYIRDNGFQGS